MTEAEPYTNITAWTPLTAGTDYTIMYSQSYNPCRIDASGYVHVSATAGPSGCVSDWSTNPAGAKSFGVVVSKTLYAATNNELSGDLLRITVPVVHNGLSTIGNDVGNVAWNSFAYTVTDTKSVQYLSSEPIQVGVKMTATPVPDLEILKTRTSAASLAASDTTSPITFDLAVHNNGPATAMAGFTVNDLLPAGLVFDVTSAAAGTGYTCQAPVGQLVTCTSDHSLVAVSGGSPTDHLTITAHLAAGAQTGALHNVAFVKPNPADVAESIPASPTDPTTSTDTNSTPTNNDSSADVNVGAAPALVSIGDYTFIDKNNNGVQDTGDAPLVGVTVTLYAADGTTVVGTTTTDANGFYSFADLTPSTNYIVGFSTPTGYQFTTQTTGSDPAVDSNPSPTTGKTNVFTTPATGTNSKTAPDLPTIDAGYVVTPPALVSIGDYTFIDKNNNGVQDTGDAPLVGVTVTLYAADGTTVVGTTTTDANGFYSFADLTPSTNYIVGFSTPTGYQFTTQTTGSDPAVDSNPSPTTGKTNVFTTPATGTNSKTAPDLPTIDAGYVLTPTALVSIGDYTFIDKNNNGVQDTGDTPLVGVTVTLYAADGTTVVGTTTTDANGFYSFADLTPSTNYIVGFSTPTGYQFTTQTTGSDPAVDSNPSPTTGKTNVFTTPATGTNSKTAPDLPTIDAGYIAPINLILNKSLTTNGNVVVGDTVHFSIAVTNGGPAVARPGFTVTDRLPVGLSYSAASGAGYSCANSGQDVTCTSDHTLAAVSGGTPTDTIDVAATVPSGTVGKLHNVAFVKPGPGDVETIPASATDPTSTTDTINTPTDNDGQADVTVGSRDIDLAITKSLTPNGTIVSGSNITFDLMVTNNGSSTSLSGFTVTDYMPTGLSYVSATGTGYACANSGQSITCTSDHALVGSNGANDHITVVAKLDATSGSLRNVAEVLPAAGEITETIPAGTTPVPGINGAGTDTNLTATNNDAQADLTVGAAPISNIDLALKKTLTTMGPIHPGDTVQFHLDITNYGPGTAVAGFTVTDTLPAGLTLASGLPGIGVGYTCAVPANQSQSIVCTSDHSLAPVSGVSPTDTISISAVVDANAPTGAIRNIAYVAPAPTDPAIETNPLVVPTPGTDSSTTSTNNDGHADVNVTPAPVLYSVGNLVWNDLNNNGIVDGTEVGIDKVTVRLLDSSGVVVTSQQTSNGGYYLFKDLPAGTYSIEISTPPGYISSTGTNGSATGPFEPAPAVTSTDNDDNGTTVTTSTIRSNQFTLNSSSPTGEPATPGHPDSTPDANANYTVDFGVFMPASLGDTVWSDTNMDGIQDPAEAGVPGVKVNLIDAATGAVIATATTDSNGKYSFTNLVPGSYVVEFVPSTLPAGFQFTNPGIGSAAQDSNADVVTGKTSPISLAAGENNPTIDAGIYQTPAGPTTTTTIPAGPTTTTTIPAGPTTTTTIPAGPTTTTTIPAGPTTTTTIPAGPTTTTTIPAGPTTTTTIPAGPTTTTTIPAGPTTTTTIPAGPTTTTTIPAGPTTTTTIPSGPTTTKAPATTTSTTVVVITVPVIVPTTVPPTTLPATTAPVTTNPPPIPVPIIPPTTTQPATTTPGTTPPASTSPVSTNPVITSPVTTSPATSPSTSTTTVAVTPTTKPSKSKIIDYVWEDVNSDGIRDPNEKPIPGVVVILTLPDGSTRKAVTDAAGVFVFDDLDNGQYTVKVAGKGTPTNGPISRRVSIDHPAVYDKTDFGFSSKSIQGLQFEATSLSLTGANSLELLSLAIIAVGLGVLTATRRRRKLR